MSIENQDKNIGATVVDRTTDLVVEARQLLAKASDYAKRPLFIGQVSRCEIGNFAVIAPHDSASVAYVADRADAQLFARAPELLSAMADEIEALRKRVEKVKQLRDEAESLIGKATRHSNTRRRASITFQAYEKALAPLESVTLQEQEPPVSLDPST